jgi:hypothetical protein
MEQNKKSYLSKIVFKTVRPKKKSFDNNFIFASILLIQPFLNFCFPKNKKVGLGGTTPTSQAHTLLIFLCNQIFFSLFVFRYRKKKESLVSRGQQM